MCILVRKLLAPFLRKARSVRHIDSAKMQYWVEINQHKVLARYDWLADLLPKLRENL